MAAYRQRGLFAQALFVLLIYYSEWATMIIGFSIKEIERNIYVPIQIGFSANI